MAGNGEERDALTRLVLKLDAKLDLIDRKVDLSRAEARARVDALRLELLDDFQTALRVELGGRAVLFQHEIDTLRAEVDALTARVQAG